MPSDANIRSVMIRPGSGKPYQNIIGHSILGEVWDRALVVLGSLRQVFILADEAIRRELVKAVTGERDVRVLEWHASETNKALPQVSMVLQEMARANLDRSGLMVALGGGLTGDVAGFAAAIYQRGISWVNCPTTLLAMVDASIGGKTAVNLELPGSAPLKNFAGAIHHPILVVSDVAALDGLPDRQFRAGLAECVKHTMIAEDWGSPDLPGWFGSHLDAILKRDPTALIGLVEHNVRLKARVVEVDEREEGLGPGGGRMALNLGHTFAHAFETLPGVSISGGTEGLEHGEAVGLGLVAAGRCAAALGMIDAASADGIVSMVQACGLPVAVAGLPPSEVIMSRMMHDKKARAGVLRLILPCGPGRVKVVDNPPPGAVRSGLDAIRG